MSDYLDKVLQAENLPNWIGLLGILLSGAAILFLAIDRHEKETEARVEAMIIAHLEKTGSTTVQQLIPVAEANGISTELVERGIYTLVAKQILLKTSLGFEMKRFKTRLFDEIDLVIKHKYPTKKFTAFAPFDLAVLDVMCQLINIEAARTPGPLGQQAFRTYILGMDWYIRERFYALRKVSISLNFSVSRPDNAPEPSQENCAPYSHIRNLSE